DGGVPGRGEGRGGGGRPAPARRDRHRVRGTARPRQRPRRRLPPPARAKAEGRTGQGQQEERSDRRREPVGGRRRAGRRGPKNLNRGREARVQASDGRRDVDEGRPVAAPLDEGDLMSSPEMTPPAEVPPPPPPPPATVVTPAAVIPPGKAPWVALLLSLLMPGLGQIYNGQFAKGLTFFAAFSGSIYLIVETNPLPFAVFLPFVIFWNMIDAFRSAELI